MLRALLIFAAAATLVASAQASRPSSPGWTDEDALQNDLKDRGVTIAGGHRLVDFASCQGIRRYGHRILGDFHQYHRFRCVLSGPAGADFSVTIAVTRSVIAGAPVGVRDEPVSVAEDVVDARDRLEAKERSVAMPAGAKLSAAQKAGTAKFLQPYRDTLADAQAELEGYRTRFWWRVVG